MNDLTRITVNLNSRAVAALDTLVAVDGGGKTDLINRATLAFSYLLTKVRGEGAVLRLHYPDGRVEAVTFL